jgi:branched-chain amino acid transport system permease protein
VPTTFNVINSMLFLCAVIVGGQGNKLGVILGAFIIVYLPNFFLGRTSLFGIPINGNEIANYKYLFFGVALMVLMIFRPQGLFPARQKLLAFGREVYVVARKAALAAAGRGTIPVPVPVADERPGGAR